MSKNTTIIKHSRNNPAFFLRNVLGVKFITPQQIAVCQSVRENRRTAAPSGHSVGKTFLAAQLVLWFLFCYPKSKVLTTAPTWFQVENLLWREIRKAHATSLVPLGGIPMQTEINLDEDWFAVGLSTNDSTKFQGIHAPRIMIVFDEATGIDKSIWEASEGVAVGNNDRFLAIGNPTDPTSDFKRVCDSPLWNVIHLSAEDHPNVLEGKEIVPGAVSKEWIDERLIEYGGRETGLYRARVLGLFPEQGDDMLISLADVERAQSRWIQPHGTPDALGVDVARFGCFDDKTEVLTNEGWKFFENISGSENVLSLYEDCAKWQPITQLHKYPFKGDLNLYEGEKISFCITDNHKLVASSAYHRKNPKWKNQRYDELPDEFLIRRSNRWFSASPPTISFEANTPMFHGGIRTKKWEFDFQDWAEFLGWFISEGNVYHEKRDNGRYRIMIAQKHSEKRIAIETLLNRMKINFKAKNSQYEFSNNEIGKHLIEHCGHLAANKKIPVYLKEASSVALDKFLTAFCSGDGHFRNGRRLAYATSSFQLANDIQEILSKLGIAGKLSTGAKAGSETEIEGRKVIRLHDMYVVYERSNTCGSDVLKRKVQRMPYDGFVYCLTTPLHTMLVRRNGLTMWSGNSDETVEIELYGNNVQMPRAFHGQDTMKTAGAILANKAKMKAVDDAGVGGGVTDRLKEQKVEILAYNAGQSANDKEQFLNRRAESWWLIRELLKKNELNLPPDNKLAADLTNIKFSYTSKGQIKLEAKDEIKKRIGRSPDRGDALAIALAAFYQPKFEITDRVRSIFAATNL